MEENPYLTASLSWGNWLRTGQFLSFLYDRGQRKYYMVKRQDLAHYEYTWPESISPLTESGPTLCANLEVTVPWTHLHQFIWGIRPQCYVYAQLPTDIERHGLPKQAKHTPNLRTIAHFGMHDSPFDNPSWNTEHFMHRPIDPDIMFTVYNKTPINITPVFNFWVNKLEIGHVGDEDADGTLHVAQTSDDPPKPITRYNDVLEKLSKRVIPCRPITLLPVRAPATTT